MKSNFYIFHVQLYHKSPNSTKKFKGISINTSSETSFFSTIYLYNIHFIAFVNVEIFFSSSAEYKNPREKTFNREKQKKKVKKTNRIMLINIKE